MNDLRTGRKLVLSGLENARNKVTLGFKVDGGTKLKLIQEAKEIGFSLSEYTDTIIAQRHNLLSNQSNPNSSHINRLRMDNDNLTKRLMFFERNPILFNFFEKNKGIHTSYINEDGNQIPISVNSIQDTFTVVINSLNKKPNV